MTRDMLRKAPVHGRRFVRYGKPAGYMTDAPFGL